MSVLVIQGDARHLPLPDGCVDLVVTSPPYFGLRSYTDNGQHYDGQIGSEATPAAYVDALVACTREWVRVLKPSGSLFVNLGDKYSQRVATRPSSHQDGLFPNRPELVKDWKRDRAAGLARMPYENVIDGDGNYVREKSLIGLPWRYALACMDQLGLILRAEIVWAKPNGLPESVQDRVRRAHEQVFHFTVRPRYYSAVDEIRELHTRPANGAVFGGARKGPQLLAEGHTTVGTNTYDTLNPLGKLPGSVWTISSQPLTVPPSLGVDHFAAFPMELPRRLILGWSPPGVCTGCGEGRRPVAEREVSANSKRYAIKGHDDPRGDGHLRMFHNTAQDARRGIIGYACDCTPYTDHPAIGESSGPSHATAIANGTYAGTGADWGGRQHLSDRPRTGPWREYHLDQRADQTVPAVVLDPFGGTGTTALLASVNGRHGITVDRSADYCRIATWRTTDPGERARAMQVPKPEPVHADQASLFDIA